MLTIKLTAAIIACFLFGAALGLSKLVKIEPSPQRTPPTTQNQI